MFISLKIWNCAVTKKTELLIKLNYLIKCLPCLLAM